MGKMYNAITVIMAIILLLSVFTNSNTINSMADFFIVIYNLTLIVTSVLFAIGLIAIQSNEFLEDSVGLEKAKEILKASEKWNKSWNKFWTYLRGPINIG